MTQVDAFHKEPEAKRQDGAGAHHAEDGPVQPVHLTPRQVAERYQVDVRTLQRWRDAGDGPSWIKVRKTVRYPLADLIAWERDQKAA